MFFEDKKDYCIFIGSMQSGKTIIFKTLKSDSIHKAKCLKPNTANVLSNTDIFEQTNIIGLNKILTSLKNKLNNCYILETDPVSSSLKHINDILVNKSNTHVYNILSIKRVLYDIMNCEYFTRYFLLKNNIPFQYKNLLQYPAGMIDISEVFKEQIEKYSITVNVNHIEKLDYEWTYEQYIEEIERNYKKNYDVTQTINLPELLEYQEELTKKFSNLYQLKI